MNIKNKIIQTRNLFLGCGLACVVGTPAFAELPVPARNWVQSGTFANPVPQVTGNTMNINQLSRRGILHWESFNIGRESIVNFNQPDATSSTLNRIVGNSVDPSRILGQLNANGEVLIINQNGIVFGDGAQVNVAGLAASTLDVSDQVYDSIGIVDALQQTLPAFEARSLSLDANGNLVTGASGPQGSDKAVVVEAGAVLRALGGEKNGRIMLFAPTVENRGSIESHDGQTMLAASHDKVYLAKVDDDSTNALLVEVDTGGSVSNLGKIIADRGNITMMGLAVNQSGLARASTAVSVNGSIHLLARDGARIGFDGNKNTVAATRTGTLTLGEDSLTEVELELPTVEELDLERLNKAREEQGLDPLTVDGLDPVARAFDEQAHKPSEVKLMGRNIHFERNAAIVAQNGDVTVQATVSPQQPLAGKPPVNDSTIVMEAGSRIDVSGASTSKYMDENVIEVELRGNQLADAPLQKNGPLRGRTVKVDIRRGTPLADISTELGGIERTLGERAATGGTVTLASEGSLQISQGAVIDISGGSVAVRDGYIDTTALVTSDYRIVDISDASPDLEYRGIFGRHEQNHAKWGIREIFSGDGRGRYEQGYIEGKDAGQLALLGRRIDFQGDLLANSQAGFYQRMPTTDLGGLIRPYDQLPLGGRLVIGSEQFFNAGNDDLFAPEVFIGLGEPASGSNVFAVSPQLFDSGISRFAVYSNGRISYRTDLDLGAGGEAQFVSSEIMFDGALRAAGGDVRFENRPTFDANANAIATTFAHGAVVDTSGIWVNDNIDLAGGDVSSPRFTDGGSITVESQGFIDLQGGSRLRADAGAYLAADSTSFKGGNGGAITLVTVNDQQPTELRLDGELSAYGFADGGSLAIETDGIRVAVADGTSGVANELLLTPDFFRNGGFSSYDLIARRTGMFIDPGVELRLMQDNRVINDLGFITRPSGSDLQPFTRLDVLPDIERQAVDLSLTFDPIEFDTSGEAMLTLGKGSRIVADPGADISLGSATDLRVFGSIDAPAGSITLDVTGNPVQSRQGFDTGQAIWVGADSTLSVRGVVKSQAREFGRRYGEVLDAGEINVTANNGFVVLEEGSLLDASAVSGTLSIATEGFNGGSPVIRQQAVAGSAGRIKIRAADGAILDGSLVARGSNGVAESSGGALTVELNAAFRNDTAGTDNLGLSFPTGTRTLTLGRLDRQRLAGRKPGDALLMPADIALLNQDLTANQVGSDVYVSAETITRGGFDDVTLAVLPDSAQEVNSTQKQRIVLEGGVDLEVPSRLALVTPILSVEQDGKAALNSAYVALGPSRGFDFHPDNTPVAGNAALEVDADFIELIGDLTLEGTENATFNSNGDLRLQGFRATRPEQSFEVTGSLRTSGDLDLTAGQFYPTTLTDFTLSAESPNSRISFHGNGAPVNKPLSAGSVLRVKAEEIEQGGILRAPFGEIQLVATENLRLLDGSLTSVSGDSLLVPFGETQLNGRDWVFDFGSVVLNYNGDADLSDQRIYSPPPEKRVLLDARSIDLQDGALVDLSGTGDLLAYEFIPGPGGSSDILDNGRSEGAFAIVPNIGLYGAIDPVISETSAFRTGDTVVLSAGDGLPAGEFAVLPPRYALLPGAYLVTPETGVRDITPGINLLRSDRLPVVAGKLKLAGQNESETGWSAFRVESGAQWRQRVEFIETRASDHFANQAAGLENFTGELPFDAGSLQILAKDSLRLQGRLLSGVGLNADGRPGRSARVDISATDIAIVDNLPNGSAGSVELLADDLNNFGAESVLIGGRRSTLGQVDRVEGEASTLTVKQGVDLVGPELLLVAKDQLTVESGARLRATGDAVNSSPVIALVPDSDNGNPASDGGGAFLRVSTGKQVVLERQQQAGGSPTQGNLNLQAGALVAGEQSLSMQASGNFTTDADFVTGPGGSLNVGAGRISLGDTAGIGNGFSLSNERLNTLQVSELILTSGTTVDLIGDVDFGTDATGAASLESLVIDAAGISGYAGSGSSSLTARRVSLVNNSGAAVTVATDTSGNPLQAGSGSLQIDAQDSRITLGAGNFAIQGYQQTSMTANELVTQADGVLDVNGDLTLDAGRITALSGSDAEIKATGRIVTLANRVSTGPVDAFGANLKLTGSDITHRGLIDLRAGNLTMTATSGDIDIDTGAVIDTHGRTVSFGDVDAHAAGGQVTLQAAQGDILIRTGSGIDVSGDARGGDAGLLLLAAANGLVDVNGQLKGDAGTGFRSGAFELDAVSLGDFSSLNQLLNQAGFQRRRNLRLRQGDLTVASADQVVAENIRFTTDAGDIHIDGDLNADAHAGGLVELYAANDLHLNSGSAVSARATGNGQEGGRVVLGSRQGNIAFNGAAGAEVTINVAGLDDAGQATSTGNVRVNALRNGTGINVSRQNTTITGAERIDIEAHETVTRTSITSTDIAALQTGTANYIGTNTVLADLGISDVRYHVIPSLEIQSSTDLSLDAAWSLFTLDASSWQFNGEPGLLTLRAANNLTLNAPLDAVITENFQVQPGFSVPQLGNGESWSLQLVAGADLNGADPLATAGGGDFTVRQNIFARTGTGDINAVAAGRINIEQGAGLISVGENAGTGSLDPTLDFLTLPGDIAFNGGDIRVTAGSDIDAVATTSLISDWQPRIGGVVNNSTLSGRLPTAWSVLWDQFDMGIGALGGGAVDIDAGGSINNLSVAIATSGLQVGQNTSDITQFPIKVDYASNNVRILGGGELNVQAGKDVIGGYYHVGGGSGSLSALGRFGSDPVTGLAPVLSLGDASLSLTSRRDLEIATVLNPTVVDQDVASAFGGTIANSRFFSYDRGGRSPAGVELNSVTGDVVLSDVLDAQGQNQLQAFYPQFDTAEAQLLSVYPGTLKARALQSDILIQSSVKMFPQGEGQLELLAARDITTQSLGPVTLDMLDSDPGLLPSISQPIDVEVLRPDNPRLKITTLADSVDGHAALPVHLNDPLPARIYTLDGDITSNRDADQQFTFFLPKPVDMFAGQDISNLILYVQHNSPADSSVVRAGRDVIFPVNRSSTTGRIGSANALFQVSGPGEFDVLAGRDVDLGSAIGLESIGNDVNTFLPDEGASISVIAGFDGIADYDQFLKLPDRSEIVADGLSEAQARAALTEFMRAWRGDDSLNEDEAEALFSALSVYKGNVIAFTGEQLSLPGLTQSGILAAFETLAPGKRNQILLEALYDQVRLAGIDGADGGSFEPGYAAIDALFPQNADARGQIRLLVSQITTEDGGDINMLTPYGGIDAGVASTDQFGGKSPDQLGILVKSFGDVNTVVRDNMQVNATRVFALDGGDILIWSSLGNIDAGSGANLETTVGSRLVFTDRFGVSTVKFPPAVRSAGIRSFVNTPGVEPGNSFLFAPQGVINAGDAGIGSAGNLTLAATQVVGADNIDVGGVAIGVPAAPPGPPPGLAGVSALAASVTRKAQESASSVGENAAEQEAALSLLSVDVLSFGESETE